MSKYKCKRSRLHPTELFGISGFYAPYKPKHIKKPDSEAWFKCNPNGEEASKRIQIVEEILKTK